MRWHVGNCPDKGLGNDHCTLEWENGGNLYPIGEWYFSTRCSRHGDQLTDEELLQVLRDETKARLDAANGTS